MKFWEDRLGVDHGAIVSNPFCYDI